MRTCLMFAGEGLFATRLIFLVAQFGRLVPSPSLRAWVVLMWVVCPMCVNVMYMGRAANGITISVPTIRKVFVVLPTSK
jgi:hypothetical protein